MTANVEPAEASTAPQYDPLSDEHTADPYPGYRRLRDQAPVFHSEQWDLWVVSRYDDVKSALASPDVYSSETPNHGAAPMCPAAMEILKGREPVPGTLVTRDDPAHANNKRPVQRALSVRKIRQLHGHIEELAQEFLDGFADRGSVEFVSEFAGPLPATVVAELLGIPRPDHWRFRKWADSLKTGLSAGLTEAQEIDLAENTMESDAYLRALIRERRAEPKDDLLSELGAAVRADGTPYDEQEILGIAIQFVVAGTRPRRRCWPG